MDDFTNAREALNAKTEAEDAKAQQFLLDLYNRALPNFDKSTVKPPTYSDVDQDIKPIDATVTVHHDTPTETASSARPFFSWPEQNALTEDHSFAPQREQYQKAEDNVGMQDYGKLLENLGQGDFINQTPVVPQPGDHRDVATSAAANPSGKLKMLGKHGASRSPAGMTLDVGTQGVNPADALAKAQDTAGQARLGNEIIRGADFAGAALAHTKPTGQENINKNVSDSDRIVAEFQARQEKEKDDPNSPMSKGFRQFMQRFGVNVKGDFTAAMGEKFAPMAMKAYEAEMTRQHQMDMKQLQMAALHESRAGRLDQKRHDEQVRAAGRVDTMLNTARGDQAAQQAEKDIYAADKVNGLIHLYKNTNEMDPGMVQLLASEVAKMAHGGVPNDHELQALAKAGIPQEIAILAQRVENHPTAANAGAFVDRFGAYANAIRADAQKLITSRYGRILESNKNLLDPADYQSRVETHVNRFKPSNDDTLKTFMQSNPGVSPQEAIKVLTEKGYIK